MFDLSSDDGSVRRSKPNLADGEEGFDRRAQRRRGQRSQEEMGALHRRLMAIYTQELDRQSENRMEMAIDEDHYDNDQYSEEDKATLESRGQYAIVYNVVSTSVDWVTGTQRRARTDYKILPRRKDGGEQAQRKTDLMKYIGDTSRSQYVVSRAFADQVKVGLGWIEDCYDEGDDGEPVRRRYESWRFMLWDSSSLNPDLTDARFVSRTKWVDLDIAHAIFPKKTNLLEQSAHQADDYVNLDLHGDEAMDAQEIANQQRGSLAQADYDYDRRRVRIIEMWWRQPAQIWRWRGGEFDGEIYDPESPGHRDAQRSGDGELLNVTAMRTFVTLMTPQGILYHGESPYRHNRYPFTPLWGFRRGRDNMPYGMIRRLRDIQQDVNKRASKALHILSTSKTIMDEDTLPDDYSIDDFLEEVSRPDAVIVKRRGTHLEINADRELSQYHVELMNRSISMIERASGVTNDNLGRTTNAQSGIAIQRRQDQGSLASMHYFDNLAFSLQISGEKQLANMEQFITEEKAFRITNQRGTPQYVTVNDGDEANDITRTKADYILSEQDFNESMRNAAALELIELMKVMPPQVALTVIDLVIEGMDLRNREEIVKRIRQITGQRDPDSEEMTPEEMQAAEMAGRQQQMAQALQEAEIAEAVAKAQEAIAKARKMTRDADAGSLSESVAAQKTALEAAALALGDPAATEVADKIMHESGFVSRTEQEREQAIEARMADIMQKAGVQPAPTAAGAGAPVPQQQAPGLMPEPAQ